MSVSQGRLNATGVYDFRGVESRWQGAWDKERASETSTAADASLGTYYVLQSPPFPSEHPLSGHLKSASFADALTQYHRSRGRHVLTDCAQRTFDDVRAPDLPKNLEDLHSHIASQAEGVELIFACRRIDEARHLTKTLARTGLTTAKEPYMRAFALGTVDGDGHVPVTDAGTYIDRYGADTVRCFMIFMGPHDHDLHFSDGQIGGVHRFLSRLWRLAHDLAPQTVPQPSSPMGADLELLRRAHQTMDHVTEAMEGELRLHMVIAAIMGLVRESIRVRDRVHGATIRFAIQTAARLLFPFAPYCAADVYHQLTSERVWEDPWPVADPILMGGRGAR